MAKKKVKAAAKKAAKKKGSKKKVKAAAKKAAKKKGSKKKVKAAAQQATEVHTPKQFSASNQKELAEVFQEIMKLNTKEMAVGNVAVLTNAQGTYDISCTTRKRVADEPVEDETAGGEEIPEGGFDHVEDDLDNDAQDEGDE